MNFNKNIKINSKKILVVVLIALFIITSFSLMNFSKSVLFDPNESVEVEANTELIYYLDISYDGVDKYANDSTINNDSAISVDTESGYIFVEDKLPEGLTFIGFVESPNENGSIGAVSKLDSNKACLGSVYDDMEEGDDPLVNYHGLHYNADTRTVSFRVRYLQAGCKLTVGIKTMTPETIDDPETKDIIEERRDFINTATAREGSQLVISNKVHAWMGKKEATLYNVSYKYEGEVPTNAPDPSKFNGSYAENTTIGIASDPNIEGYTFSGWTLVQVEGETPIIQTGSKFVMPARDVELVGHFEKIDPYKVIYKIADGSPIPTGYELPSAKEYYPYQIVQIDSTKAGDKFDGYKFSGWTLETEGIEVSKDNDFVMPEGNVVIVGSFEKIKYKVEYKFTGTTLPENPEQYLPETKWYEPNQDVTLTQIDDSEVNGYKFLGWYKENKFIMPEEDVIIYGEWKVLTGYFEPKITKEIYDKKDYYKKGDVVKYKITIENNENFAITDVQVKEHNNKAKFIEGEGYNVRLDQLAIIPYIDKNSLVTIEAEYKVTDEVGTVDNTVQIVGATATLKNYELNPNGNYYDSEQFKIYSELKIRKNVKEQDEKIFQFHITSEKGYDTWVNLTGNSEKTLYIEPDDSYKITEVVPQEYILESVTGDISGNGESIEVKLGENYAVEFTNKHQRKPYYHSDGRVSNEINNVADDRDENGDGIPDKYQVTIYYEAIHGYFNLEGNPEKTSVVVTKYDESGNLSMKGTAILKPEHIPTSSAYPGYVDRGFWQGVTPTKDMVVKNGDTFIIKYFRWPSNPSTAMGFEGSRASIKFIWNDEGFESERPTEIRVELLRNYESLFDSVILNEENNWTYEWDSFEDGMWGFSLYLPNEEFSDLYEIKSNKTDANDFVITYTYFTLLDD